MKVWVFYGGSSSEREVSLRTGQGVVSALQSKGYDVLGFDIKSGSALLDLNWRQPPDFVFLALHGTFGEDGSIQGFLSSLGVPFSGSGVASSAICFHKGQTKRLVQQFGVPCPASFDVRGIAGLESFLSSKSCPRDVFERKWYLKAARQGSTIGIERFDPAGRANPAADFRQLINAVLKFDEYVLIEEWVEGAELTATVLFGKALPVVEIRPLSQFYNYESKYTAGKTEYLCPAPLPPEVTAQIQAYAEKAFEVLECEDYARADFILSPRGPVFLEMNTLPGMTATSLVPKSAAAAGMDYANFVDIAVKGSFERWKQKRRN
ncbi:MAG: D-alanine--D-alanine ligase [Bdellovibrionales bacterium]|nr:D-alanine--D-alanine ligase [Bdellovibrionales bacterium]